MCAFDQKKWLECVIDMMRGMEFSDEEMRPRVLAVRSICDKWLDEHQELTRSPSLTRRVASVMRKLHPLQWPVRVRTRRLLGANALAQTHIRHRMIRGPRGGMSLRPTHLILMGPGAGLNAIMHEWAHAIQNESDGFHPEDIARDDLGLELACHSDEFWYTLGRLYRDYIRLCHAD